MSWVCPSCQLEFEPESHDLARCHWQKEVEVKMLKWSEYALIRTAYQVASPSQRERLSNLAKQAEAGDRLRFQELKEYALGLVQEAEAPARSKAAGGNG